MGLTAQVWFTVYGRPTVPKKARIKRIGRDNKVASATAIAERYEARTGTTVRALILRQYR